MAAIQSVEARLAEAIEARDEARAVARLWRTVALEAAVDIRVAAMMDASEALEWLVKPDRQRHDPDAAEPTAIPAAGGTLGVR